MSVFVLDASALLAMLLDEPGSDRVAEVLHGAYVSAVNLSEVAGFYAREGAPGEETRKMLEALPIRIEPFDHELAYDAAALLPATKSSGLSFGDRACLALATRLGAVAMTADRAWSKPCGALGIPIEAIR